MTTGILEVKLDACYINSYYANANKRNKRSNMKKCTCNKIPKFYLQVQVQYITECHRKSSFMHAKVNSKLGITASRHRVHQF